MSNIATHRYLIHCAGIAAAVAAAFTVVSMPRPDTTAPGTTSIEAKTTACESLQTCCTQTCCLQTWPYYEHSCLRDSRRQGGDAQPVRLIALNGQARHYVSQQ